MRMEVNSLEVKNLVQNGNEIKFKIILTNYNTPYASKVSPEFMINGSAMLQVKIVVAQVNNGHTNLYNNLIFIKFVRTHRGNSLRYTLKLSSVELKLNNKCFSCDEGTWHLLHENRSQQYTFDLEGKMDVVPCSASFVSLHDDTELTDFELRGSDGSVHVHRAVLAASSPVLRRMLGGTWRETAEGHVDIPGTSRLTLQHLKDYVYLQSLPDVGIEQLLLLASYYMMPDLEQRSVDKLVSNLNVENALDLLEFAAKNKITSLELAILESVQNGAVKVSEIRQHLRRDGV